MPLLLLHNWEHLFTLHGIIYFAFPLFDGIDYSFFSFMIVQDYVRELQLFQNMSLVINMIMVNYELSIGVRTISGDVPFAPMLQTDRGQSNVARS